MRYEDLPKSWQNKIKSLRADCARYRTERNELLELVTQLEADVASLRSTVEPRSGGHL